MRLLFTVLASIAFAIPTAATAAESVQVVEAQGDVRARAPKGEWKTLRANSTLATGSRVKTGANGKVSLRFADGTITKVRPKSQIIVRAAAKEEKSGVTVFFGRVWAKVVKRVSDDDAFEVHSANAVAGVRGTQFEVGVADDGSTRVIVKKGAVAVGGEAGKPTNISAGFEIESDGRGRLANRRRAKRKPNWDSWFAKRAKVLQKKGLEVAKDLDGRLNRRKAKLEKLLGEQKRLKKRIDGLERQRRAGQNVEAQLQETLDELERVTARIVDMRERLQAAFGLFDHWEDAAEAGMVNEPGAMKAMCGEIRKIAADFADMIEEGTDMSMESMDEMMDDMGKGGGTLKPKKGGAKDIFKYRWGGDGRSMSL